MAVLSGRVLLVEDEDNLRQTLTRILRQAGCEVTSAVNAVEALQRMDSVAFDLVYLDIHLPGNMNGLQALRLIMQAHPQVQVVLFTAYATLETAIEALRAGATDYIIKPIHPEQFIRRTEELLKKQALERRRRALQTQIAELQAELAVLDSNARTEAPPTALTNDRFVRRGRLVMDLQTRHVVFGEREPSLPPSAFEYLLVLARHAPDVVDYQTLVTEAQGYQSDRREAQELAKWHIHELRLALEPDVRHPRYILNVRGVGYRLVLD